MKIVFRLLCTLWSVTVPLTECMSAGQIAIGTPPGAPVTGFPDGNFVQLNEDATIIVGKQRDGTPNSPMNCNPVNLACSLGTVFVVSGDVEFREFREDGPISELLRFPEDMQTPGPNPFWVTNRVFLFSDNDTKEDPKDNSARNPRCPELPVGLDCNDQFGIPTERLSKNGNNLMKVEEKDGPTIYRATNVPLDQHIDYKVNSDAPEPKSWLLIFSGLSALLISRYKIRVSRREPRFGR